MYKVVILIEQQDGLHLETQWPAFLRLAEAMPGLQREATSRVDRLLYGDCRCGQMHELFFNTLADVENALASPQGQATGRLLQQITGGRITLFIADHKEDEMENIRKFTQPNQKTSGVVNPPDVIARNEAIPDVLDPPDVIARNEAIPDVLDPPDVLSP